MPQTLPRIVLNRERLIGRLEQNLPIAHNEATSVPPAMLISQPSSSRTVRLVVLASRSSMVASVDKVCEPNVTDDQKLVNVAKKVKKKPVSKSHGKKKSEDPSVDGPLIHTERDDVELWFKLGDKAVRFGIEEFFIITGLDCTKFYDVDLFKSKKLLAYKEGIFCMHGLTGKLTVKEVASVFFSGTLKDDEYYVKIALVYFFAGYLYGYPQGKKIDNFIFAMVNGDDYIEVFNRFGWGKLLWQKTFHHLKIALKDVNNTLEQLAKNKMIEKGYKLKGFPIAFLIWLPTTEFSELIQVVFNNPKIVVKDFVALSGEKSQSLFSKFKFDLNMFRRGLVVVCLLMKLMMRSSLRIEFLSEFAKLAQIINGLKKKENDGSSKDSEFFSSPIREAYYQDISNDGGGLQLSIHTVQAEVQAFSHLCFALFECYCSF
ncbi:hypothetical protein F8388_012653 [Cannabis sativa]|uniref:DUF1985 domain-containing protein n=1 Tax=Cannabis sativa TaxID=3483 RepID=A0A7J6HA63_CANSA|nr:hypothetical protein F8388_012653 [Cannabis sativa]